MNPRFAGDASLQAELSTQKVTVELIRQPGGSRLDKREVLCHISHFGEPPIRRHQSLPILSLDQHLRRQPDGLRTLPGVA